VLRKNIVLAHAAVDIALMAAAEKLIATNPMNKHQYPRNAHQFLVGLKTSL